MTEHAFADRQALERHVGQRLTEIMEAIEAAQGDAALFPTGLTPAMSRALSFARGARPPLMAPPEPETAGQIIDRLCRAVDAERDRRTALDFSYDFGETPAFDDVGQEIAAGVRQLQMGDADRANWQALQGAALTAVVSGQPAMVMPMRAEDNWNIQTTATQVLQVLAAMIAYGSALLFHGGTLKSAIRAAEDPSTIDTPADWPEQP